MQLWLNKPLMSAWGRQDMNKCIIIHVFLFSGKEVKLATYHKFGYHYIHHWGPQKNLLDIWDLSQNVTTYHVSTWCDESLEVARWWRKSLISYMLLHPWVHQDFVKCPWLNENFYPETNSKFAPEGWMVGRWVSCWGPAYLKVLC